MSRARRYLRAFGAACLVLSLFIAGPGFVTHTAIDDLARAGGNTVADAGLPATAPPPAPADTTVELSTGVNAPAIDDLAHEVYSAVANLHATLVLPSVDFIDGQTARLAAETVIGAGVEIAVDGTVVPRTRIGKRTIDKDRGTTTYEYFGVAFRPGPNVVETVALGANGARGPAAKRTIYGPGSPVTLSPSFPRGLHADGKTLGGIEIVARDAWNHPAAGAIVHVSVVSGDAQIVDPVSAQPADGRPAAAPRSGSSADLHVGPDGVARGFLVPGLASGNVGFSITSGSVSEKGSAYIAPFIRYPMVTGIISGGVGAVPGSVDGDGIGDNGGSRKGRVALYGVGRVGRDASATVAYETANRLGQSTAFGPFVQDPSDRPYQSYGDTSSRRNDALSDSRLYARVESGRNSLLYGRFVAQTGSTEMGNGFTMNANGLKATLSSRDDRARVVLFQSRNDLAYAREVYNPNGLATLGRTVHGDVVVGTESVVLVALDRRTGAVVTETPLQRNIDYTFDYVAGGMRFISVPLPYDLAFNPQVVLVTYQYYGAQGGAKSTGGRAELGVGAGHRTKVGVGYVNDVTGTGSFTLMSQDVTGPLHGGSWSLARSTSNGVSPANAQTGGLLNATQATTLGLPGGSGTALRARIATKFGNDAFSFGYDATTIGFSNPFGGFTTPGFEDLRGSWRRSVRGIGEYGLSYDAQKNTGFGAVSTQRQLSADARRTFGKRFTLTGGLDIRSHGGSLAPIPVTNAAAATPSATPAPVVVDPSSFAGSVTQAHIGIDYRIRSNVGLSLTRTTDLGGSGTQLDPTQTNAQIDYTVGATRAYLREQWTSVPQSTFANATSGVASATAGTRSTIVGIEQAIGRDLSATTQYELDHTAGRLNAVSTIGIREKLHVGAIAGDASIQTSRGSQTALAAAASPLGTTTGAISGAVTPLAGLATVNGFNVYGLNLGYGGNGKFHTAGSVQFRTGDSAGSTFTLGAGGPLGPSVSLLGRLTEAHGAQITSTDAQVGLSWRPVTNDRGAGLLEYERHNGVGYGSSRSDILAYEQLYRPRPRLELVGRVAYKLDGDADYAAHTALFGLRIGERIGDRFDIGVETRHLSVTNIAGAAQTEFAVEAGTRLLPSLRIAAGYNFEGSADPALTGRPTRRGAYVTATSVIDRILGWGDPRR